MNSKVKPSKIFYSISSAIFIFGIILFISILLSGVSLSIDQINIQMISPGTKNIHLKETGKYSVFFESRSKIDEKVFVTKNMNGLLCSLKNIDTGKIVDLKSPNVSSHYSMTSREGNSIFDFEITKPGMYEFKAWYESSRGEDVVLAIGKDFVTNVFRTVLLSLGVLFISLGISITMFIVTLLKRRKAKVKVPQKDDLIIRESFAISHNNGEMWAEELDSLFSYSEVVESKFLEDMIYIRKPSSPSVIAINLNQTTITESLAIIIINNLIDAGSSVKKVAFVGLDKSGLKIMKKMFKTHNPDFVYKYFDDFVKAKEWLI